ncbi:hypothetical protein WG922_06295 [Ramlibacter sp. AN1015]|uniref:hypothetical protein n=1 Tax=Ramlibacter sp. AN1015 TaxID=3133428 RepID=UPI0030BBDABA
MNHPTPAIVAQGAVRPLPRLGLLLLCTAYVLAGFVGREPWKTQDMTAFGYMFELARGSSDWWQPRMLGQAPDFGALLPYWLGAWAIRWTPDWVPADLAARLPFVALLVLTLAATWWGVYHLARRPQAQPVAFAFGGEARPVDYARAMADGSLLALLACLGLAQLSHETTPALAQLGFTSLAFYGLAALPGRRLWPAIAVVLGLAGLSLSGAPTLAVLFGLGGALALAVDGGGAHEEATSRWAALAVLAVAVAVGVLAAALGLWVWNLTGPARDWVSFLRLVLWFTWPAWPLAAWTVWRWRLRLGSRHVALPLSFVALALVAALATRASDRALLLGLPALAALAAFALPTLRRTVSALIDWFTLLFFTGCGLVIWVVWISLQTGIPPKPALNVYKLAPGFEPSFSLFAFAVALAGTLGWAALVRWRVGRHRSAIWKSLVLPAGGAAWCWLLVMTLWLPVLDYARSYVPSVQGVLRTIGPDPGCVEVIGLTRGQVAALHYHGRLTLRNPASETAQAPAEAPCRWRVLAAELAGAELEPLRMDEWLLAATVRRPTDARDTLRVYRRLR